MPVVWIVLTLLVTLGSVGGVGFAISTSEEAGKTAALVAAFPLAFCWSALLAALGLQLFKKGGTGVRVGLPLGCGFLGALVFFGLVAGFLLVIFPQL